MVPRCKLCPRESMPVLAAGRQSNWGMPRSWQSLLVDPPVPVSKITDRVKPSDQDRQHAPVARRDLTATGHPF
jgi:hypothetical protein